MKWSITELNKFRDSAIEFKEELDLEESLIARDSEIIAVAPVKVTGSVFVQETGYLVRYTLDTMLALPSTRSLEPVEFCLNRSVEEVFMTEQQFKDQKEFVDSDDIMLVETDMLNLQESVEDHILLSIPFQIYTEEEEKGNTGMKGNAWELISEESYQAQKTQQRSNEIDPRLAKLADLLDNNKESNET